MGWWQEGALFGLPPKSRRVRAEGRRCQGAANHKEARRPLDHPPCPGAPTQMAVGKPHYLWTSLGLGKAMWANFEASAKRGGGWCQGIWNVRFLSSRPQATPGLRARTHRRCYACPACPRHLGVGRLYNPLGKTGAGRFFNNNSRNNMQEEESQRRLAPYCPMHVKSAKKHPCDAPRSKCSAWLWGGMAVGGRGKATTKRPATR